MCSSREVEVKCIATKIYGKGRNIVIKKKKRKVKWEEKNKYFGIYV